MHSTVNSLYTYLYVHYYQYFMEIRYYHAWWPQQIVTYFDVTPYFIHNLGQLDSGSGRKCSSSITCLLSRKCRFQQDNNFSAFFVKSFFFFAELKLCNFGLDMEWLIWRGCNHACPSDGHDEHCVGVYWSSISVILISKTYMLYFPIEGSLQ